MIKTDQFVGLLTAAAGGLFLLACAEQPPPDPEVVAVVEPVVPERDPRLELFAPLPELMVSADNPITLAKVNLGRKLYYDKRLSKNQDLSCNSCHKLGKYGIDGRSVSLGHNQQPHPRNAPSVYNAAGHSAQFWDGRAATVEEQAGMHLLDPLVMAMPDEEAVVAVLKSVPGYAPLFAAAFPGEEEPITFANVATAIGAFERGLVTRSPFDDYLAGDDRALKENQKAGLTAFLDAGCADCHAGPYVGGATFRKLGFSNPWGNDADAGRFGVTGDEADRQVFKVPSLRNVSHTAPYFNDGSVSSLNEAVRLMGNHQLGVELQNEQVISIIAFLNALDGKIDEAYVIMPELPESGAATPAPDPS